MRSSALRLLLPCFIVAACGKTDANGSGSTQSGPGTGDFSVTSDEPTAGATVGASFSLSVSFTTQTSCATLAVGACTVNPCYGSIVSGTESAPLPTAGLVVFTGPSSAPLDVTPQSDGNYATETVPAALPWTQGGSSLSFGWAHFPGNAGQAGDTFALSSPPYIALTPRSAFGNVTSSLARSQDLALAWKNDTTPGDLDEVSFDVISGSAQVYCIFNAAAEAGAVPAAALGHLEAGEATFSIVSKEHAYESINAGDGAWGMNFNVNAVARTSYGLAKGSITVE